MFNWKNFTPKNGITSSEKFNIDEYNNYIKSGKIVFTIEDIFFHEEKQFLKFTKVRKEDKSIRVINHLIKINENLYVGSEPDETVVRYERIF